MPDVLDIAEKNLKKKCPPSDNSAVSKQDDCIMNESENTILEFWARINNAEPKFSAMARALLAYYQVNNANKRDWYCRNEDVRKNLGGDPNKPWSEATLQKYKRELVERHVISSEDVYGTGKPGENGLKKGCSITVHFDWNETNNHQKSNVISSNTISSSANSSSAISDRVLRREDPLEENRDLSKGISERREAAPTSESAAQKSSAEGSHSTGEIDLLKDSAPLPEKPEKPKGKNSNQFIVPTLEEVIAKLAAAVEDAKAEGKGEAASWDHNDDPRYAANFYRHYSDPKVNWTQKNGKPLKSWELALVNTWLERDNYKVPWKKNQPQRQQLAGQKKTEAEIMAVLTGRNTTQETFETESNRISQNLEISRK